VLVVDNYDSFVYNLVQYLGELGADPVVHRHDAVTLDEMDALGPDLVLISPGPGRPRTPVSERDHRALRAVPDLGVCLGHQAIGQVFGGDVVRADRVMHGKTSLIHHQDERVHRAADPFEATRATRSSSTERLPAVLEITAETDDGTIMGLRHREHAIEGVQFHPESVLTASGHQLLANFLAQVR
jgi:anthranilate synthase/aminodeoxychorismate synthase-like glutamine amidotransferase